MLRGGHAYPFRPACRFSGKDGRVALDQVRTVDRERLRKRLGVLTSATLGIVFATLAELFEFLNGRLTNAERDKVAIEYHLEQISSVAGITEFSDLAPGEYTATAQRIGMQPQSMRVLVAPRFADTLLFRLGQP